MRAASVSLQILLTKLSDVKHTLEVVRDDGSCERLELVTREFLFHDLLHYAIESAVGTQEGVWGALAAGKTMAEVNDRSGTMLTIEQTVGMMTGAIKRSAPAESVIEAIRRYHDAIGDETPRWFTAAFVTDVRERMRKLQGRWNATGYGKTMELEWPT